jgi:hypothetical protein
LSSTGRLVLPTARGAIVAAAVLCLSLAAPAQAGTVPMAACDGSWHLQPSPHPGLGSSLAGVAAFTATDVWAVGSVNITAGQRPLIEHWNGSSWSVVPSPTPATTSQLQGVDGVSSSDVWAVGAHEALGKTLIERWDGTSWTVVPSPSPGVTLNRLTGVAAIGADDVWAVGLESTPSGAELPLAEHWNGSSWTAIDTAPLPPNDGVSTFLGVAGTGADDVWAVGYYGNTSGGTTTLAEHWDGASWAIVSSPSPTVHALLSAVSAISPSLAFGIGEWDLYPNDQVLAVRWDGSTWVTVPADDPMAPNDLVSVSVPTSGPGWAVGSKGAHSTLTERLTRTGWKAVTSPQPPGTSSLLGVSTLAGGSAWAVGTFTPPSGQAGTLVEFVC